jgi:FADH2-dependent halogenase
LLARAGRRAIVLEREKFPRFHIGESLLPFSTTAFDRLGVREKLDRAFMPKHGGEIVAACGSKAVKFYFKDGFRSRRDRAYQVTRSEFDELLLNHSRENGAEVREETTVKDIVMDADHVRLEIEAADGATTAIECRYLLDCSGRQTVLGNFFKLKKSYDHLQKFSVFSHYENVDRELGIDGTLIRMVRGLDRWFWMIPLTATRMSIGVVMDTATFRAMKLSPEAVLEKCIDEQPMILIPIVTRNSAGIAGCWRAMPPDLSIQFLAAESSWRSCRRKRRPMCWTKFCATNRVNRAFSKVTRAA